MDDHIRKLDTKIQSKETELNALFTKIQKLEEEIATLYHKKLISKKTGNSRNVINRRPRCNLWNRGRGGEWVNYCHKLKTSQYLFNTPFLHSIIIYNIYMEDYFRLLAKQQSLSGGTSLISMYIPPNGKVSLSKQKLTNEMGLVSNIKSKIVQKHTKTALKSAL